MSEISGLAAPSNPEQIRVKEQQDLVVDMLGCEAKKVGEAGMGIDFNSQVEIQGAHNDVYGLDQSLIGVLSIDEQHAVGLVRATVGDVKMLCVTKLDKDTSEQGTRAKIITIVEPGSVITLGRKELDTDNPFISRNHAKIDFQPDGKILITDTSSNQELDLVTKASNEDLNKSIAPKGIFRALRNRRRKKIVKKTVPVSDFLTSFEGWSAKSEQVYSGMDQVLAKEAAESRVDIAGQVIENSGYFEMNKREKDGLVHKATELINRGANESTIEILAKGRLNGKRIDRSEGIARYAGIVAEIRKTIADMVFRHPDTAKEIIEREIVGFHGTGSAALADILQLGSLLSASEARKKGLNLLTGEHVFQKAEGQQSISFTNMADTTHALSYAGSIEQPVIRTFDEVVSNYQAGIDETEEYIRTTSLGERVRSIYEKRIAETKAVLDEIKKDPNGLKAQLLMDDFPVLVGISYDSTYVGVDEKLASNEFWSPIYRTSGDYNEFRPAREAIPLDELVIAVPESRIEKVRRMLTDSGHTNTIVLPVEHFANDRYDRLHGTNYAKN